MRVVSDHPLFGLLLYLAAADGEVDQSAEAKADERADDGSDNDVSQEMLTDENPADGNHCSPYEHPGSVGPTPSLSSIFAERNDCAQGNAKGICSMS